MGREPHADRGSALVQWETAFGSPAPAYLSVRVMQKAVAYEAQRATAGGLSAQTRSVLRTALKSKAALSKQGQALNNGAHLIREWNGRTYKVAVLSDGFELNGTRYKSLSAIARQITGTAWSGPRFFGLTKLKRRAA